MWACDVSDRCVCVCVFLTLIYHSIGKCCSVRGERQLCERHWSLTQKQRSLDGSSEPSHPSIGFLRPNVKWLLISCTAVLHTPTSSVSLYKLHAVVVRVVMIHVSSLKLSSVSGKQHRRENSPLWCISAADYSLRSKDSQSNKLVVCNPGHKVWLNSHLQEIVSQEDGLDGIESTGKIKKTILTARPPLSKGRPPSYCLLIGTLHGGPEETEQQPFEGLH